MKSLKEILAPIASLLFICILMGTLMAFTYNLTEPLISANANSGPDYKTEMFPDMTFEAIEVEGAEEAWKSEEGAFVFVTAGLGYNKANPLQVMTGFAPDGTIAAVYVINSGETEGIGSQVLEAAYLDLFKGATDGSGVDVIAGATKSSEGMVAAINLAADLYQQQKGA